MATGSVVKQQHDCSITLRDGAALSQSFGLFTGEVSISSIRRKRRSVEPYQVRGRFTGLRHQDLDFPTFTLTVQLANWSGTVNAAGTSEISPADAFNRAGAWVAATSTLPVNLGGSDVFCLDVDIVLEGTDFGDASDHTLTLEAVHGVPQAVIGAPGTWQIECTVYGDIAGDLDIAQPTP